ncbi:hypothetical protein ABW20_dc0109104 [Dactylellina cionopaga]|nr:hypothetical protein ABW20_dc0109104 [Dactylellina cionopaga]
MTYSVQDNQFSQPLKTPPGQHLQALAAPSGDACDRGNHKRKRGPDTPDNWNSWNHGGLPEGEPNHVEKKRRFQNQKFEVETTKDATFESSFVWSHQVLSLYPAYPKTRLMKLKFSEKPRMDNMIDARPESLPPCSFSEINGDLYYVNGYGWEAYGLQQQFEYAADENAIVFFFPIGETVPLVSTRRSD